MDWISVKDRLPEKGMRCLAVVYYQKDYYSIIMPAFSTNLKKLDKDVFNKAEAGFFDCTLEHGFWEVSNVLYWMPLPEMPEELMRKE